jgi:2-oxoisovalerate dehydrogenase E2 component (dihydrolipoyl transacylase)
MATTITMPQLGETVTEGTVAQWLKQVGDSVEKYEAFVEVSTDKVNAEVPAPVSGVIRELIVKEGETVPTGAPIAIIDEVGAVPATAPSSNTPTEQIAEAAKRAVLRQAQDDIRQAQDGVDQGSDEPVPGGNVGIANTPTFSSSNGASGNGKAANGKPSNGLRVSPAVRRLAREHAVDYSTVSGTGTGGRVTANDILAAAKAGPSAAAAALINTDQTEYVATSAPSAPAPTAPAPARAATPPATGGRPTYGTAVPGDVVPLTQARKIIAQRMVDSKHTAPHAWTMVEVDVTNVWKWRAREKDAFEKTYGVKLTLLPFFMRAVVESLAAFPLMNSSWTDGRADR